MKKPGSVPWNQWSNIAEKCTSSLRKARRLKIENHLTKKNLQAEGFFYVPGLLCSQYQIKTRCLKMIRDLSISGSLISYNDRQVNRLNLHYKYPISQKPNNPDLWNQPLTTETTYPLSPGKPTQPTFENTNPWKTFYREGFFFVPFYPAKISFEK